MNGKVLKIPTDRRQTSWLLTKRTGVEFGATKDKSIQWQGGEFDPGTSGFRVQRLTARPRSPPWCCCCFPSIHGLRASPFEDKLTGKRLECVPQIRSLFVKFSIFFFFFFFFYRHELLLLLLLLIKKRYFYSTVTSRSYVTIFRVVFSTD